MNKRSFMKAGGSAVALTLLASACTTTTSGGSAGDPQARAAAINADAQRALTQLYSQARGSEELVKRARGVLVFPNVVSAGFIVGGSHGPGVLMMGGQPVRHYTITSVSAGLLVGAQSRAVFYLFMTEDALKRFQNSSGWVAGTDASVAVANIGANAMVDTTSAQHPVIAFVLTNAGLMANISVDGMRIVPLNL